MQVHVSNTSTQENVHEQIMPTRLNRNEDKCIERLLPKAKIIILILKHSVHP